MEDPPRARGIGPQARSATQKITLHYFLTNLGLFGLLSTLAVWLTASGYSPARTGLLVLVFTVTNKVAKVPLARWLDRLPPRLCVLLGCATAALGFLVLRLATGMYWTTGALVLAGLGVSVNALASKQLAADASDRARSRAALFSLINVAVNIAAAVAAPLALYLVDRHRHGDVMTAVAVVYLLAGVTTFLRYAGASVPRSAAGTSSLSAYRHVLRLPGMLPFLVVNFFGWLCYGQLFNALAVHVSMRLADGARLGWLYTLNAVMIVGTQLLVTRVADRWSGGRPGSVAVAAYATFGLAFLVLSLTAGYIAAAVAVAVFTLAEMLFVPTMDVLLLEVLGPGSRAIGYGVFSLSNALGEAVGGGVGVGVYRWAAGSGHDAAFWFATAVLAVTCAAATYRLRTPQPPATTEAR